MSTAREATNRLSDLLRREHHALADFLVALAAFDAERRWVELGHKSLFYFLHRELGLPKGPAYYRKIAAELIQRYPEIAGALRDGRLNLTSIVELSKVITPENHAEVLPRFFHTSKREAKEVSAAIAPTAAPPLRTMVTVVRPPATAEVPNQALLPAPLVLPEELLQDKSSGLEAAASLAPPAPSRSSPQPVRVEPLTADLRRIHVTVSRRLLDKLSAARDALSHSHPGASEDEILEVGLDLILQRHAKRRGLVARPRKPSPAPSVAPAPEAPSKRSRYIRADVAREVWRRDEGCCRWPLEGGGVCASTYRVQFDHIHGWALGADTTVEELRLLCSVHQDVHARRLYGNDLMNTYTRPKGGGCSEPVAEYGPSRRAPRCDAHPEAAAEMRGTRGQRGQAAPRQGRTVHRPGSLAGWVTQSVGSRAHVSQPGTRLRDPRAAPPRPEPLVRCPPAQAAPSAALHGDHGDARKLGIRASGRA